MKGTIRVDIGKDAMEVRLWVLSQGDTEITADALREELSKRGVMFGIREDVLNAIVARGETDKIYIAASGKPPVKGRDGFYKLYFDNSKSEHAPTIQPDGSVNYSPVLNMVKKGDKLAEYHPARQGEVGHTVFGSAVAPAPAKEAEKLRLLNVEQQGNDFFAKVDGRITLKGKTLEVKECLVIEGDAGFSVGNIHFNGDVHIMGDVMNDVEIHAGGSIEIDGVVEGARIVAGRNLIVRRGIHGKGVAVVQVGENLTSKFIEAAKEIKVGNDILVDYMANTNAYAGGKICAAGKKGLIMGGRIESENYIEAYTIGHNNGTKTQLSVRSADPKHDSAIIIRDRAFPGTSVELQGKTIDNLVMTSGELIYMDGAIETKELGFLRRKLLEEQRENAKGGKYLILLVDDDPVLLKTEYAYLCEDYKVVAVSSAHDALVFLKKKQPDLILLDYLMPKMNGGQLLEKIRNSPDPKCASTPVFFITGVADNKTRAECLRLYPQGYLMKPIGKKELLEIIGDFFLNNKE